MVRLGFKDPKSAAAHRLTAWTDMTMPARNIPIPTSRHRSSVSMDSRRTPSPVSGSQPFLMPMILVSIEKMTIWIPRMTAAPA
jgi:hypothetical protein